MSLVLGYGSTAKQRKAAAHARNVKRMYSRERKKGGFAIAPIIAGAMSAHKALQGFKPITKIRDLINRSGVKFPNNPVVNGLSSVGNFLIKHAGYGRSLHAKKNRRLVRIM